MYRPRRTCVLSHSRSLADRRIAQALRVCENKDRQESAMEPQRVLHRARSYVSADTHSSIAQRTRIRFGR
jgi:hypothetical protein